MITNFQKHFRFGEISPDKYIKNTEELSKPFIEALSKESDRAIAIIATCLLDNLLEKLITVSFIDDPRKKHLFKNDHILQTFYAKINIAYYSGLIPKFIYDDLKLICEIRNRFAHEVTQNLDFKADSISKRINKFSLKSKTLDNIDIPRIKFICAIQAIITFLYGWELTLTNAHLPTLVELFRLNEINTERIMVNKEDLSKLINNKKKIVKTNIQK
jgi:DNA-binding MltR family transcriptional regulator